MSLSWGAFEHQIWRNLKASGLSDHSHFVLAVSGGVDSIVLLHSFLKVKPEAHFKIVHFHHGDSADEVQNNFRQKALSRVQDQVLSLNKSQCQFYHQKSEVSLVSEEQMREARWKFIRSLKAENDILVTAHHLDDRLETLLLKMLRGTSPDGLVAFKMWNGDIFRPFLNLTKVELLEYAEVNKLNWVEDASNADDKYLRNWIRNKWLPDLEEKHTGATRNLAQSLLKIVSNLDNQQSFELVWAEDSNSSALSRPWYLSLSQSDQLRALALFLKKHQMSSFTSGQLEEIRKRLDKNQKDITFELLERKWVINALQIMLQ